jgi:hypothetical protein
MSYVLCLSRLLFLIWRIKETALSIGPDSGPAITNSLKKRWNATYTAQLAAFFSMTLQLPRILALLTGKKGFIFKTRWRLTKGIKKGLAPQH